MEGGSNMYMMVFVYRVMVLLGFNVANLRLTAVLRIRTSGLNASGEVSGWHRHLKGTSLFFTVP